MEIISLLIKINQYYYKTICQLLLLLCRFVPLRQWAYDELYSPKYQKFKTDKLPIIKKFEKQDYKFLLEYYLWRYKMTLDIYGHLSIEGKKETSAAIGSLLDIKCF